MRRMGVLVALAIGVATAVAVGTGRHGETAGHGATASRPAPSPVRAAGALPAATTPATPATRSTPTTIPPKPKPNRCAGNTVAQFVLVSVARQHVWMCARARTVYDAPVTTGAVDLPYDSTPTGTFQVQGKQTDQTLTLLSGAQYQVKYWVTFDAPLFGFHDASWQEFPFGSQRYRTEGSHGCVHMPLPAMAFLYKWAEIGATVTVRG